METALGPRNLIVVGPYAPSVAVHIAVDKYGDHLPLERQARIMTRQGLTIDPQTLWDQIDALEESRSAYERLHHCLLGHDVLGADETPWGLTGHQGKASKRRCASRCEAGRLCDALQQLAFAGKNSAPLRRTSSCQGAAAASRSS